jgi:2-dehydropantoate 2-reductase
VPFNVVNNPSHQVHRATSGVLCIGESSLSVDIAKAFNAAGIETLVCPDMRSVQWGKLLLNLGNPVNAISDLPLLEQLQDRSYRRVLASLQDEALAALSKAGIRPAKITHAPPALLPHILRLPNWLFLRIASRMLKIDATARSSMWEDVQHGRPTEIDDLCGAVVRLARQQGLQAPKNEAMCRLIAGHRKGQRMGGDQLSRALQSGL